MVAYVLRFQEPRNNPRSTPSDDESDDGDRLRWREIVCGTKTMTEIRQESPDNDPRAHDYLAVPVERN